MKKPFVICHMLTSLNGKIDGDFMSDEHSRKAREFYEQLRETWNCEAIVYGQVTMRGSYAADYEPILEQLKTDIPLTDHLVLDHADNYIISIDPLGSLAFDSDVIRRKNKNYAIIQILSQKVSKEYLQYLQSKKISYLICAEEEINCRELLKKLSQYFRIEKVLIAGGGKTNDSFLQKNLIDELSLVICPVSESNPSATSFEALKEGRSQNQSFELAEAQILEDNALWLRYRK